MEETTMDKIFENQEFYQRYIDDFAHRQFTQVSKMDNSEEAFYYLMREDIRMQNLSETLLIETANKVNRFNPFILKGLRTSDEKTYEINKKIPPASQLPQIIEKMITNYNMNIFDDPFLNEAMLHIGIIKFQLFEDGNHRTANLITNYNLIKQGLAPIIIKESDKETYDQIIDLNQLDSLASLFKRLSIKESKYIYNYFLIDQDINNKHY